MDSPYHRRGHIRSLLGPVWHHLRSALRDPAYRALHRFQRQIGSQPRFQPGTVRMDGKRIHFCDNASFLSAWDDIFVNRIYDIGDEENPLLIDVGANIGLAALYWKRRYRDFRYLGFEPDPAIAAVCRSNLEEWKIEGGVRESAVGAVEGEASFSPDGADAGRLIDSNASVPQYMVRVERLSAHLDEPIDLLKIDVEGKELEVIADVEPKLHLVHRVFVEWHCDQDVGTHLGTGINILEKAGFRVYVQVVQGPPLPFVSGRHVSTGVQYLNLSAVRE